MSPLLHVPREVGGKGRATRRARGPAKNPLPKVAAHTHWTMCTRSRQRLWKCDVAGDGLRHELERSDTLPWLRLFLELAGDGLRLENRKGSNGTPAHTWIAGDAAPPSMSKPCNRANKKSSSSRPGTRELDTMAAQMIRLQVTLHGKSAGMTALRFGTRPRARPVLEGCGPRRVILAPGMWPAEASRALIAAHMGTSDSPATSCCPASRRSALPHRPPSWSSTSEGRWATGRSPRSPGRRSSGGPA